MSEVRYGPINPDKAVSFEYPVAASMKFLPVSAHFVFADSSGHMEFACTATNYLFGWAVPPHSLAGDDLTNGYWTSSAVAGTSKLVVYPACINLGVVFRAPCTAAAAIAARVGECADIVGTNDGTIQYVTPGTNATDVLLVVGLPADGDTGSILVCFNPEEIQMDT